MIITRSPLRITLGGGGTDIPAYYREHGGMCVAAAIDKYVYITLHETFAPGITLKYSKMESVKSVDDIEHPIFREALRMVGIKDLHLEIASHADIPAGTGLGSSSSFTCALLKALYTYRGMDVPAHALAEMACELEIDRLGEPIGKQDQFMAAYGGLNALTFCADDTVEVQRLRMPADHIQEVEDRLLMFYTGISRSASQELQRQKFVKEDETLRTGYTAAHVLLCHELADFAKEINLQWDLKYARSAPYMDTRIIASRDLGLDNGANACKLVGAGGGGFLMFWTYDKERLRTAMHKVGLKEARFCFDHEGTKVVMS